MPACEKRMTSRLLVLQPACEKRITSKLLVLQPVCENLQAGRSQDGERLLIQNRYNAPIQITLPEDIDIIADTVNQEIKPLS